MAPRAKKPAEKETPAEPMRDRELVKIWKERIQDAIWFRDKTRAEPIWKPCLKAMKGSAVEGEKVINILLILAGVLTLRSSIYFKNPTVNVKPKRKNVPPEKAKKMQMTLRLFMEEDDGQQTFKGETRKVLTDALYAIGVFREIYQVDSIPNPKAGQTMMRVVDGKEVPEIGEDGKELKHPARIPVAEHFRTVRVSPFRFFADSTASQDMVGATLVGEEMYVSHEDIMADPQYTNPRLKDLKPDLQAKRGRKDLADKSDQAKDPRRQFIHLYRVEDLKRREILTFAEGFDEMLHPPRPMPKGLERGSYTTLQFINVDGDEFYGIPLVYLGIEPQKAYNQASNHIKKLRIHDVLKWLYMKGALTRNGKAQLENREDSVAIELGRKDIKPQEAVAAIQQINVRQLDVYSLEKALSELNRLFGLTSERFGGKASADTLGQSQMIQQQSDIKEADRIDLFTDAVRLTIRKKAQRIQSQRLLPISRMMTDYEGNDYELTVNSREELEFEADYEIEPGSTLRGDPLIERALTNDAFTRVFGTEPQRVSRHFDDRKMAEELAEQNKWGKLLLEETEQLEQLIGSAAAERSGVTPGASAAPNSPVNPDRFPPVNRQILNQQIIQRQQAQEPGLPVAVTGVQT